MLDVVEQAQSTAVAANTGAGLTVGRVMSVLSTTVGLGNVISQNPWAGRGVVSGTVVDLVLSSGGNNPPLPVMIFLRRRSN